MSIVMSKPTNPEEEMKRANPHVGYTGVAFARGRAIAGLPFAEEFFNAYLNVARRKNQTAENPRQQKMEK